jgi:HPt (histidine-containing phosphotransfer) domain-containing protein
VRHCLDRRKAESMRAGGIDADAIIALWGAPDSPSFLGVASVFVAELEVRMTLLPALLAGIDRAGLELHAHAIRGAAANVGATAIHTAALRLEAQSRTASADELAALAAGLRRASVPAMACLQSLVRAGQD